MHDQGHFDVVFNGEIAAESELIDVKQQMADMFQLNENRVEALFTGQPVVIKKDVTKELAEKYKGAISQAGGISVVVEMMPESAIDEPDVNGRPDVHRPYLLTANAMTCPVCGHRQPETDVCNRCNVNIDEYQDDARLRQKKARMQHWLTTKQTESEEQPAEELRHAHMMADSLKSNLLLAAAGLTAGAIVALATAFTMTGM